ncbi:adenylyltransferase/sulfurtransferase [Cryobacterium mesophilum]|uniref:ThiF family adenylyltransferase n=1 Tax=Terrimesophilobacter mesophilus TaxID=433647 RepID=UPI0017E4768E|nr:adenylyltransferase/sulfurtransferase [Terrimesophilobacter mesophilus]
MSSPVPLVEPGARLAPERLARYSRQLALPGFDDVAQRRLANARVLVIGAGGLGSASVPYLASAGVGTIGVIDTDVVELSNLHRQIVHGVADIGRSKLDSIADTVAGIDPATTIIRHDVRVDSSNILDILADYDVLLDGSDNFPTRYLANDAAALTGKPLVWGAILQYHGQVGVAWAGHGPTYRDLFPTPPAPGTIPSCSEGGVLPSVCAVVGAIMGAEAIKLITGIGRPLLGTVTTYDALSGRFREIDFAADPDSSPITELIDYEAFCGISSEPVRGDEKSAVGSDLEPNFEPGFDPGFEIDARRLADLLADGDPIQLIDIREPYERAIAAIEPSELIPLGTLVHRIDEIRRDIPVVLYCHTGVRSASALAFLRESGFHNASHLVGGIDSYSATVSPALVRY